MNALQLALRNLVWMRRRTMGPLVVIALLLCALDLFAGSQRSQVQQTEQRAAFEQGFGQLAILPLGGAFGEEGAAVSRVVAATPGIALVVPRNDARGAVQRYAAYLTHPDDADQTLALLEARLRTARLHAQVRRGQFLSEHYRVARQAFDTQLAAAGLAMLALVGAMSFAVASVNCLERRRELAVLRAFGLPRGGLVAHVMAEALMVGMGAIVLAVGVGSLVDWSIAQCSYLGHAGLSIELDPRRVLAAVAAVLGVVCLATLQPALKAAAADVTASLRDCEQ